MTACHQLRCGGKSALLKGLSDINQNVKAIIKAKTLDG